MPAKIENNRRAVAFCAKISDYRCLFSHFIHSFICPPVSGPAVPVYPRIGLRRVSPATFPSQPTMPLLLFRLLSRTRNLQRYCCCCSSCCCCCCYCCCLRGRDSTDGVVVVAAERRSSIFDAAVADTPAPWLTQDFCGFCVAVAALDKAVVVVDCGGRRDPSADSCESGTRRRKLEIIVRWSDVKKRNSSQNEEASFEKDLSFWARLPISRIIDTIRKDRTNG